MRPARRCGQRRTRAAVLGLGAAVLLALCPTTVRAGGVTERDVVRRALSASPTLRAAALDLGVSEAALRAAEAAWLPVLHAGLDGGHTETLGAHAEGVVTTLRDTLDVETGMTFRTSVGTEVDVSVLGSLARSESDRSPGDLGVPGAGMVYGAEARILLLQPLLRGAGRDVGEADLRAARLGRTAGRCAREQKASEVLLDVLTTYWELWYAQEAVSVEETALTLAVRQADEARLRATHLGTVAPTDVLRFESEVATLEASRIRAAADRDTRGLTLAGLLAFEPEAGLALRAASTAPVVSPAPPSVEVQDRVVSASSELLTLSAELAREGEQIAALEDATLPRLDLVASVSVGGAWDDTSITSLGLPSGRPAVTALVGLRLELPLGSARAEARLEAAARRVDIAERQVDVAARLASAEEKRLDLGLSTPLQVVEAREQHRKAQLDRLRATVDAQTAAITVAHLTGDLLPRCSELVAGR